MNLAFVMHGGPDNDIRDKSKLQFVGQRRNVTMGSVIGFIFLRHHVSKMGGGGDA